MNVSYVAIFASRISPIAGGAIIASSIFMEASENPGPLWISGIGIVVGIFVALTGMLYHNMESRLTKIEEEHLPRREFEIAHKAVQDQLFRIEGHLSSVDNRNQWRVADKD